MLPTPPHSHSASEELFFVLGGSGLAWQDEAAYEVRAGDCAVYRANELEHTFRAGPDGLEYLVYGTNFPTEYGWLPRSGRSGSGGRGSRGRTDDPWEVERRPSRLPSRCAPNGRTTSSTSTMHRPRRKRAGSSSRSSATLAVPCRPV